MSALPAPLWAEVLRLRALADAAEPAFAAGLADLRAAAPSGSLLHAYADLLAAIAAAPLTLAQLGQTLDGRIATEAGHSHYINGPAALDHLHRLRALSDAVIIGAGTALADNPQLTVRRVAGGSPVPVVIDPHRRLPPAARLLHGAKPALIITTAQAAAAAPPLPAPARLLALPDVDGCLDPAMITAALRGCGLRTLLIEGGSLTVSRFLETGVLDRLYLMVAPLLLGSGRPALVLPAVERIGEAIRLDARLHPLGEDWLIDGCLK
jgi:riboflavin-specific deaminase-like protein